MKATLLTLVLLSLFQTSLKAVEYDNKELKFSMQFSDNWVVKEGGNNNQLLSAKGGESEIYVYIDPIGRRRSRFNIRQVRQQRDEIYIPDEAILVSEDVLPFHNFLRDRIVRVFRLSNGNFLKQLIIVRKDAIFLVYIYERNNDFSSVENIIESINVNHTIKGNFYLSKDNTEGNSSFTIGVIGVAILAVFAALGYFFGRYRRWKKLIAGLFAVMSLAAFGGLYYLLKQDTLFAIIGILFYFLMWMSLQKTAFTRRMNKIASRIEIN